MIITNNTTVKDVEGCPFIGVVDTPMFMHIDLDETYTYNPYNFNKEFKTTMNSKPISVDKFSGNYRDLVEKTIGKGGMVYFYPTDDGKIVHTDFAGNEYVGMATVKLTNYHFNQKVYESVRNINKENVVEIPQKNYKYILIRK